MNIAQVGAHRQQPKEGAQDVFALRDPRHRFHVGGMPGKERRHHGARPNRSGHRPQNSKKQQRVGQMEKQAREMMAGRQQAVQPAIQHVRKPGERMPVHGPTRGQRPSHAFRRQSLPHLGVFRHVNRVIVIDELAVDHR